METDQLKESIPVGGSQHPKKAVITHRGILFAFIIFVCLFLSLVLNIFDPIKVLMIFILLIGAALILVHPYLGVLVYIVFEYASVSSLFVTAQKMQLGKLIVIFTFLFWLLQFAYKRKQRLSYDMVISLMIAWLTVAIINQFIAFDTKLAMQGTFDFAKWVIICILIINLVDTLPKWKILILVILVLNLKMSQTQIWEYITGLAATPFKDNFIREGMGGAGSSYSPFFRNAGDFGVAMCVIAPLAFFFAKSIRNRLYKFLAIIMFSSFTISIFMSGARGNALALLAMLLLFWIKSSKKAIIGLLLVILMATYWITSPDVVKERFISAATDYKTDTTSFHRVQLWKAGLNMFIDHPLTGVGMYNFGVAFSRNYRFENDVDIEWAPHNIFIQALSESGLIGFLSMLLIIIYIFRRNKETRRIGVRIEKDGNWIRNFADALDFSLIGFMVSGSFLTVLYYPHLYIIIILTLSLNHIARRIQIANEGQIEQIESPAGLNHHR